MEIKGEITVMEVLSGKVAIVTGASLRGLDHESKAGIGLTVAMDLAAQGARIVLVDSTASVKAHPSFAPPSAAQLESSVRRLRDAGYDALGIDADVGNSADVKRLMKTAVDRFGRLDILVNNAGLCILQPVLKMDEEVFDLSCRVMLKGTFLCSREAARIMIELGNGGRIVNISSILGKTGSLFCGAYSAAKAGIIGLSRVMSQEWATHGITVNTICPGYIDTELLSGRGGILDMGATLLDIDREKQERILLGRVPLGRFGNPRDVSRMVAFLCSPDAAYITGQAINIDGGAQMV